MSQVYGIGIDDSARKHGTLVRICVELVAQTDETSIKMEGAFKGLLETHHVVNAIMAALDVCTWRHFDIVASVKMRNVLIVGPSFGLAFAAATLCAVYNWNADDHIFTGEVQRNGHVIPIGGLLKKLESAKTKTLVYPKGNCTFSNFTNYVRVANMKDLKACLTHIQS